LPIDDDVGARFGRRAAIAIEDRVGGSSRSSAPSASVSLGASVGSPVCGSAGAAGRDVVDDTRDEGGSALGEGIEHLARRGARGMS
jgi:hypothetical protein